jgi:phosphate:Na+ symporter
VGLVDAGFVSFYHSLGVIFGANIGTTITSQLIALNVTSIAPYIILLGFFITYFGRKYQRWGKPIFYFGLVFFSLSLISLYIDPVKTNPATASLFASTSSLPIALLIGLLFTSIVQSSTVTSGLAVVLAGGGLLGIDQAFGIILGANLGTTITVILASLPLGKEAKRVAVGHFLFNLLGLVIILPFFDQFVIFAQSFSSNVPQQVATAHIIFNLTFAFLFLILIKPYSLFVKRLVR